MSDLLRTLCDHHPHVMLTEHEVLDLIAEVEDAQQAFHGPADLPEHLAERVRLRLFRMQSVYWCELWLVGAEHETRVRGVYDFDRNEPERAAWVEGMWHVYADAVLWAPLPVVERGQMLADLNDRVPERYQVLDLTGGPNCAADEMTAYRLRALVAFVRAAALLNDRAQRVLADTAFAQQLLGLGPYDPIP